MQGLHLIRRRSCSTVPVSRNLAFLCGILLTVGLPCAARAQTASSIVLTGSSVADAAVPALISPSAQGSQYFVLNQDFTLLTHSSVDSSLNGTCAAPSGFTATSATPRTFLNDTQNAYFTGQTSGSASAAVSGFSFIATGACRPVTGPTIAPTTTGGTTLGSTFATNDVYHGRYYVLSAFNGSGPDTLTLSANLNNALSGGTYVQKTKTVPLDTGAQYTSMVTDVLAGAAGTGLTAITELKTATSPGNLWVFNPSGQVAYQILGPGGVPLPAVGSFILPAQTDGGGSLLVLVNQDKLTTANLGNPPQDTTPFTIIDLGQLLQTFTTKPYGGTITLPFVTQISATAPYFAMLGAAYNPVTRLVYAVVGGGSANGVTGSVISYDPFNPGSPNETIVADISNIPFNFGGYPQLALDAAGGVLQILTPAPQTLYSAGITGTGNTATLVTGSIFADSNFTPTMIASNPLLGETYIASASGQVDILKVSGAALQAVLSLQGPDIAVSSQSYSLRGVALSPTLDSGLNSAVVTVTATAAGGGTPFTFATSTFGSFFYTGGSVSGTFPATGDYLLKATVAASPNYPALSTNSIHVKVASNSLAGVYAATLSITAPTNSVSTAVNVLVNFGGSTYAPTGQIAVKDATGATVGSTYLTGGALVQPITIAVTLPHGTSTLAASYGGDAQNAPTTSPSLQVSVGTTVTPTLTLTAGATAYVGNAVAGNVKFASTTTTVPTGNVTIYGVPNGSTTPVSLTTVTAAQAFTPAGANFSFNAPAAGTYELYASYAGDANYASATTAQQSLVTNPVPVNTATTLTGATSQSPGVPFSLTIIMTSAASQAIASGNVVVTAVLNSTGASTPLTTIPASHALQSGGVAVLVNIPTAGVYTVTASYAGDANYNASSSSLLVTVGASTVPTTMNISAPSTVAPGASFVTTVSLKLSTASTATITGNVTLMATGTGGTPNSYVLGSVSAASALASGGVQITGMIPAAGTYTLSAVYAGDANFGASTASVVTTANTYTTGVGLSGTTNLAPGVASPLTIRLTPQNGATATPTGSVVITSTSSSGVTTTLGTITAAQALASGGYQAQLVYSLLGSYTVTATYAGDAAFSGSTASLVVVVSNGGAAPTTLGISGPVSTTAGSSFIVTASLRSTGSQTTPITGNVTVGAQGTGPNSTSYVLGTVTAAQALVSGGVQLNVTIPVSGTYTLSAVYPGDSVYAMSAGNVVVSVGPAPTAIKLVSPNHSLVPGQPFNEVVFLTSTGTPGPAITGNIVLTAEASPSTGAAPLQIGSVSASAAYASGSATCTCQFPAGSIGSYNIIATYAGDANYAASTTSTGEIVDSGNAAISLFGPSTAVTGVAAAFSLRLNNAVPSLLGTSPQLTVSSTLNGAPGPQAKVDFDTAGIGTTVNLVFPTAGTYTVIANYPGDTINPASASAPVTVVVTAAVKPAFSMVLNTVTAGVLLNLIGADGSASTNMTLTASGGYNTPLALTITPAKATKITFTFLDASGKPITSLTPSTAGSIVTIRASGPTFVGMNRFGEGRTRLPVYFAGGLLCLMLSGLRRSRLKLRKSAALLGIFLLVGFFGTLLGGCFASAPPDDQMTVTVTATPINSTQGAAAQSIMFQVGFNGPLEQQ